MTLDLKNTTLLFVETRAHEITKRVIEDCIAKADFGDILIYTDKRDLIPVAGARYITVPDFPNKHLAGEFYYGHAMMGVETDFALMLEWDAGIHDPANWRPEFFDYDYVGAPWRVSPHEFNRLDVGNGGFTLMSRALGRYACENLKRFPIDTDWTFCRNQRHHYEAAGFKWPDRDLAGKFSWELLPRDPEHFGFHGAFNWPTVLPKEEVVTRAKIMLKSDYLTTKLRDLYRTAPWIVNELTPAEAALFADRVPPGHILKPRIPGILSPQQRAAMMLMQAQRRRGFVVSGKGQKA